MARFTGSLWKKSRRLGISLTGTGKELEKRPYPPGQHGANQRRKISEYGLQQQEKQKLRYMYGLNERQYRNLFDEAGKMQGIHGENFMILLESRLTGYDIDVHLNSTYNVIFVYMYGLNERQYRNLFDEAGKMQGIHGENFMILLESRLDNLVYRLGFARTRRQSRQLVNHGHITVDGQRVDIPSYRVKPGQVIGLREKSKNLDIIKESLELNSIVPDYLSFDDNNLEGTFTRLPERSELPAEINEALIVEFYSRH